MEMVVGVVVWSFSAVLWMCDRWWVMVLAGSMVKIKGEGMLSFFFLLCFIFIFNCTHFPLSCQLFFNFPSECFFFPNFFSPFLSLIFIQFFHSIFFFFSLKYLLSLSLFPPFFLNLFLFFCYGTFLFMYPSHFLPSSALFSILFFFFFNLIP
ncbi:hypothetical protein BDE02_03G122200 [Populus trichocarpa]|nr:hypothetical protein BDE02_03G122200 [Populus trichocarpa]